MRIFEYPRGYHGHFHTHGFAKLVYPLRGLVSVVTPEGRWLATPLRGVIIPSWQNHRIAAAGNALLHSVFVDPRVFPDCLTEYGMISVTPLLHELIREAGHFYADYKPNSLQHRLLELIVALLRSADTELTERCLPVVKHPRIRTALENAGTSMRSAEIARRSALSPRHFSRVFKADTGMAFKDWRALHQVQSGLTLLHQGKSVSATASELGFSSTSAFITIFGRVTGRTPGTIEKRNAQQ